MNASGPRERATFTLSPQTIQRLEQAVPRNERSRFVEAAVEKALRAEAVRGFRVFLDAIPKVEGGENSADFLRRMRLEWDGRPRDVLEGKAG